MKQLSRRTKTSLIIIGIIIILAAFILALTWWLSVTFGVSIREILYTLTSPLKGSDTHFLGSAVKFIVPWILAALIICIIIFVVRIKLKVKKKKPKRYL